MNDLYPTRERILKEMDNTHPRHPPNGYIAAINKWKTSWYYPWHKKLIRDKRLSIESLIAHLKETNRAHPRQLSFRWGNSWIHTKTLLEVHTITGDRRNPSILSALHEFGHAIQPDGISKREHELRACVFSIGLFRECFPREFARLEWKGHMLRRKTK